MSVAACASAPARALPLPTTSSGRPILSRADLEAYDPRPQRAGGRERFFCPIHGGDHQRSLTVDPETGGYTCHACGARGTLREHWPDTGSGSGRGKPRPPRALSVEEIGRRALDARGRADAERTARLATEIPVAAATFLARLPLLVEALRNAGSPDNAGTAYLRGRGLDPTVATALGVGYAAPNAWPGDHGRRIGRLVYPLADPMTGRVVGALGRLCTDPSDGWSDKARATFKGVKQRKLAGCPAGVWPSTSVATALQHGRPLVVVEGPADALALLQHPSGAGADLDVVALCGTANVLAATLLRQLPGVVLALDGDGPGAAAAAELRVQCALAGVRAECLPAGWLGDGAKDAGELAQRLARGEPGADEAYDRAVAAVAEACVRLVTPAKAASPVCNQAWNQDRAEALIGEMLERCNVLYEAAPEQRRRDALAVSDAALDAACEARDWPALVAAIAAYEKALASVLAGATT